MTLRKRYFYLLPILALLLLFPVVSFAEGESIDYSDAPSSYGLAWHKGTVPDQYRPNGFVEWLGPAISPDEAPPAEDTEDDGVTWTPIKIGQNFDLTFQATLYTAFWYNERVNVEAWIDYNQNGVFDVSEKALDWYGLIYSIVYFPPTVITQTLSVPPDAVSGNTWMRVRLWYYDPDDLGGLEGDAQPTGEIQWGEVEDYQVSIDPPTVPNNPPVANAGGPYSGNEGSPIAFDGALSTDSDPGDYITNYEWDLDNDGVYEVQNNPNPSYAFADNGTYQVNLRVTDSYGATDEDTAQVTVNNVAPSITLFSVNPNPVYVGQEATFTVEYSDPGADTFTFDWDFDWQVHGGNSKEIIGGGESTVKWTYNQTYSSSIYPTVWVRDDDGGQTYWFIVGFNVLANNPPSVEAGGPYSGNTAEPINLQASGNDIDGHSISYSWDLDNDGIFETNGQNISYSWATAGTKTVAVKAEDEFGAFSTDTATVEVYDNKPVALFTVSPNPAAPNQTIILDASGSYHGRPDRAIVSYDWDFGDGTTGNGMTTTHTYSKFGNYTVTLKVTDNNVPPKTAMAATVIEVNLGNQPPVADAGGPYKIKVGETLNLDGSLSSDPDENAGDYIVKYEWDINSDSFFDVFTETASLNWSQLNSYGINQPGTYPITLRVTDTFGATGEDTTQLNVVDNNLIINPSFELDTNADGIPDKWTPFQFTAGDGRSTDFAKEGTYSLKIVGNGKCKRVYQRVVVSGNSGEVFTLSGFNKTDGASSAGGPIGAIVFFNNTDGTKTGYGMYFNKDTHDWTYRSRQLTAVKAFSSIDVYLAYSMQTGTAYFDDLKLIK